MTEGRFRATFAGVYLVVGLASFAPILNAGFVADDWEFLSIVSGAKSVLVCFEPLVGRFVRPWVVLTYYANYKAFGLWPFPYHLTVVLLHILNAWLVCLVAQRIDAGGRRLVGAAAGLLFLVFAGHTEAVSWVAGVADPALLPFLLGGLLCLARALETGRPARAIAAGWALYAGAMLAKETSVIFPALAIAYGALHLSRTNDRRRTIVRTLVFVSVPAALVAGYFVMRAAIFGDPLSAYGGLGTSTGIFFQQARAFLLRTFLPPSPALASLWLRGHDIWLIAAGVALVGALALWRRRDRGALVFSAAAVLISVAPALPLTISIINTESERYVYVPSAFSSMLLAVALATYHRRALAAAALAAWMLAHVFYLERANRAWREAGTVFDSVVSSFAASLEPRRDSRALALILNMPDNVRGAYVFRNGFFAAVELRYPHLRAWVARTRFVASHGLITRRDRIHFARVATREYAIDVTPNAFLQPRAPATVHYRFPRWESARYTVRLEDNVWNAIVLTVADGRAVIVDEFAGAGVPFGVVDIPQEPAVCPSGTLRFSGWALDDEEVTTVEVARDRFAGESSTRPDGLVPLAIATWAVGTRPDIAAAYKGFPHVERAEWNHYVPCQAVSAAPGRALRVHVIAADARGHRAEIGVRTVRSP